MSSPVQPLVSFVLLAYNQEKYIREAVEGAFSQTYSPLEIILSDDCSKDRTFSIMEEMATVYNGPHKIVLNRNAQNFGLGRHYSKVMELASGEIVELAAGDDISLPWRTADSVTILKDNPDITCVSLKIQHFTDDPIAARIPRQEIKLVTKWSLADFLGTPGFFVNAPGRAFRKFTHDFYGPLTDQCPVEDGPNLLRCLLHGRAAICENIGVLYRWNGVNMSDPKHISTIPFSSIYTDYLSTISIAYKRGQIDLPTHNKLTSFFKTKKQRSVLLEYFHSSSFPFGAVIRILASNHFSLKESIKLFAKRFLSLVTLRR